jgi:uncharacterized tellurite resistance protein B-like protein
MGAQEAEGTHHMTNGIINIFQAAPPEQRAPSFDTEKLKQSFNAQRSTDWTIGEAFLCLILSAIGVDGRVTAEEQNELMALSTRSRALKSMNPQQLAQANQVVSHRIQTRPNGLEEACQSLPTDMRLTVFAHCVDIILADGELHQVEADYLNKITTFLGLDRADAERVQQVLLIKNRF